jgi:Fe-S cluster assembly protein SufD
VVPKPFASSVTVTPASSAQSNEQSANEQSANERPANDRPAGLNESVNVAARRVISADPALPSRGGDVPALTLPTAAREVWRYSRVDSLDLDGLHLAKAEPIDPGSLVLPVPLGEVAATVVVVNGRVESVEIADTATAAGLRILHGDSLPDLPSVTIDGDDSLVDLGILATFDAIVIEAPPRAVVRGVVQVCNVVTEPNALIGTRLVVNAGAQAEINVVERIVGADVRAVIIPLVEVDVADGASVRFLSVQELGPNATQIAHQQMRTGRDATLRSMSVALGGSYARVRTDAVMVGSGGFNELLAVYFGEANQMHDFRTLQHHVAPHTTSELLFKGAVEDQAQSVYSGLIRIGKDARRTVANQANRNLVLSPGATAESVPNLEIENNDVKCSHASAVGPVDDDHRYYLELRGVPTEEAERLIVLGFFADVLDRSPIPGLTPQLSGAIAEKFERRNS